MVLVLFDTNNCSQEGNVYTFNFPKAIENITNIQVKDIRLTNTRYTIDQYNNQLRFSCLSVNYVITIPSGLYSIQNLTTTIKNLMNTAVGTTLFTVTYSSLTSKVTISTENTNFNLYFSKAGSCYKRLGFKKQDYTGNKTYTAENIYNMSPIMLNVRSSIAVSLSRETVLNNSIASDFLASKPIDTGFKSVINTEIYSEALKFSSPQTIRSMNFSFFDEDNVPFDTNGIPIIIFMEMN